MPNAFGLHFDGDLRRIYEVPENSSFTVDGGGLRIYTPDDVGAATKAAFASTSFLWSRFVDYRDVSEWSTLAFVKTGGAFRFVDQNAVSTFQTFDIRLLDDWLVVPADYPHNFTILGNLFESLTSLETFDDGHTSGGVSPRVFFSDSLQTVKITSGSGLDPTQAAQLAQMSADTTEIRLQVAGDYPIALDDATSELVQYELDGVTERRRIPVFDKDGGGIVLQPGQQASRGVPV